MRIKTAILLVTSFLLIQGCSSPPPKTGYERFVEIMNEPITECKMPASKKPAPLWMCGKEMDVFIVQATERAKVPFYNGGHDTKGRKIAYSVAKTTVMPILTKKVEKEVEKVMISYYKDSGINEQISARFITKAILNNISTRGIKHVTIAYQEDKYGTIYVIAGMKESGFKEYLKEIVSLSMYNSPNVWNDAGFEVGTQEDKAGILEDIFDANF